ncbi:MAG: RloB domain-containing protein [Sulfurospirillum sp.]|nr:RloB domain-containing protein [Sulfurospirillum sp.]
MARTTKKTRNEKKAVLIALEDTKSSRFYFQSLINDIGLRGKIIFSKHIGTNPSNVLKAITSTTRYKEDYEKQWIVIDKDEWSKEEFNGTIKQAKDLGVCCAFSNESYELWILLHFEQLTRWTNREELNSKLKKYKYDKKSTDTYAKIKSKQDQAIENAKHLIKKHINDDGEIKPFEQNPLTNIFELVECLRAVVKNNDTDCICYPKDKFS